MSTFANENIYMEVTDIMEDFDMSDLAEVFDEQFNSEDLYTEIPMDNLKPIHMAYKRAQEMFDSSDINEESFQSIQQRYYTVCQYVIDHILEKFGMELDENYIPSNISTPALATILYNIFIIRGYTIIRSILNNYMANNFDELVDVFENSFGSKDAAKYEQIQNVTKDKAIIIANIYDVTDYSFTLIDMDDVFDYINKSDIEVSLLKELIDRFNIRGDFVNIFRHLYKENLSLKSKITFEIITDIINNDKLISENTEEDSSNTEE